MRQHRTTGWWAAVGLLTLWLTTPLRTVAQPAATTPIDTTVFPAQTFFELIRQNHPIVRQTPSW